MKIRPEEVSYNDLFDIIEDMLRYFDNEEECDYDMNQHVIGIRCVFCGHAMKAWKRASF